MCFNAEQSGLLFDVRRSARYHDRRMAFYERLEKVTNALTIMTAGAALSEASGNEIAHWLTTLAAITAIAATADLVTGFGRMADLHRNLKRRFGILEGRMVKAFPKETNLTEFQVERLDIELEEPPVYRVLDSLCRNEVLLAQDYTLDKDAHLFVRVSWWQRLTAQLCHWSDHLAVSKPK